MKYLPLAILAFTLLVNVSSSYADPVKPSAPATPEALVADLYKKQDSKAGPFFQTKSRDLIGGGAV